jgi:hypothetical protein
VQKKEEGERCGRMVVHSEKKVEKERFFSGIFVIF